MQTLRDIQPSDLYHLRSLAEPQISRDGRWAAVLVIGADEAKDSYQYGIYLRDLQSEATREIRSGFDKLRSIRFSSDGKYLAWIQSEGGSRDCILAVQMNEVFSESTPVTLSSDHEASRSGLIHEVFRGGKLGKAFVWHPNQPVIYAAIVQVNHQPIKVYRNNHYKSDGGGLLDDVMTQIWQVRVDHSNGIDGEVSNQHRLYEHPKGIDQLVIDAAGKSLGFTAPSQEVKSFFAQDIYLLDIESGACSAVTDIRGPISAITFSPDCRTIAWVGHQGPRWNDITQSLWITDVVERATSVVTEEFDRPIAPYGLGDVRPLQAPPQVCFSETGAKILFLASDRGVSGLYTLSVSQRGGMPAKVLSNLHEAVSYFSMSDSGDVLFTAGNPIRPDALYVCANGQEQLIYDPNQALIERLTVREPMPLEFCAPDGLPLEGWLLTPKHEDGHHEPYPLILVIHGGPHNAYGYGFQMEFQTLCAAGFAVLYVNPRGSQTYGQAFASAVIGDWGGKDSQDLLQAVDTVIATGLVDPHRIGVTGYSYGGFMTNWLIAHTERFQSAVSGGCVANLVSFHGTSDIGPVFGFDEHCTYHWEDAERLWKGSPLAYVNQVNTPLLLYHAETDDRCPIGQSEEFYTALATLGNDVTFVRYPEGSHLFLTQGRPTFRVDKLNRVIEWFTDTLPKQPEQQLTVLGEGVKEIAKTYLQ